jgi:hypothetical protein
MQTSRKFLFLVLAIAVSWSAALSQPSVAAADDGFRPDSAEYIALDRLHSLSLQVGGLGWAVGASADGAVRVYSTLFSKVAGTSDFLGIATLAERGQDGDSARFCDMTAVNMLFGAAVAVSADGTLAVVSAPGKADTAGYVYGYLRSRKGWRREGWYPTHFGLPSEGKGWRFGMDLGLSGSSGTTLVIGAPDCEGYGKVWYFLQPQGGWGSLTKKNQKYGYLGAGTPESGDEFGRSVAISADDSTIVVGVPGRKARKGMVCVFKKPAEGWLSTERYTPIAVTKSEPGDAFGQSVAVSSDGAVIAVGAPGAVGGVGAVYVVTALDLDKASFMLTILPGVPERRGFGISVDISEDGKTVAVGSYGKEYSGSIRVYKSPSAAWENATLAAEWVGEPTNNLTQGSLLGFSLDLVDNGRQLFVGAPMYNQGKGSPIWLNVED